eukprot:COSAG01_NODE_1118_length_11634_cov_21.281838_4_plen_135_part_00
MSVVPVGGWRRGSEASPSQHAPPPHCLAVWLAGAVALPQAQLYNISHNFAGEVVVIHAVVDTEDDSHDGFSARPDSGIVPQMEGAALMQAFGFDAQNAGMRPAPQTPVLVYCFAFAGHLEVRARTGAGGEYRTA